MCAWRKFGVTSVILHPTKTVIPLAAMSSLPETISYLIRWLERIARSGSRRDSVRGSVGAMSVPQSRPDSFVTVDLDRDQL